jgi:hypothetical protein
VRVPKAGGTLYCLSGAGDFWSRSSQTNVNARPELPDSSLLLMCDILPTGVFAAFQALNHPKMLPMSTGLPFPTSSFRADGLSGAEKLGSEDTILTIAVVGLGPVGLVSLLIHLGTLELVFMGIMVECACISLLDMLATRQMTFRVVAVDLVEARREKMKAVYAVIDPSGKGTGEFIVASADESQEIVQKWTDGIGCNCVLEVCFLISGYQYKMKICSNPGGRSQQCTDTRIRPSTSLRHHHLCRRSRCLPNAIHWPAIIRKEHIFRFR